MTFSPERLTYYRELNGYGIAELAARASISKSYLSELEAGKKHPTDKIVKLLAIALRMPTTKLEREQ